MSCSSCAFIFKTYALQRNFDYVFPEKEQRALSPNFHIDMSVIDLYIYSHDRCTYFPAAEQADQSCEYINRSQKHDVGVRTEAVQFLFWEYLLRIFDIVSLQYGKNNTYWRFLLQNYIYRSLILFYMASTTLPQISMNKQTIQNIFEGRGQIFTISLWALNSFRAKRMYEQESRVEPGSQ